MTYTTITINDSFSVDYYITRLEYRTSVMTMMTITISLPEERVLQPRRLVLVASGSVHNNK